MSGRAGRGLARRSGQSDDATTDEVGHLIRRVAVFAEDWLAMLAEAGRCGEAAAADHWWRADQLRHRHWFRQVRMLQPGDCTALIHMRLCQKTGVAVKLLM